MVVLQLKKKKKKCANASPPIYAHILCDTPMMHERSRCMIVNI